MIAAPALDIHEITVTFSRWGQTVVALRSVSLSVPVGQWLLLVGHNGSGKTTLLKTISARIKPDAGYVDLGGVRVGRMSGRDVAQQVFHVHQDPLLGTAPKLTLFENLLAADREACRMSRRALTEKYRDMLRPLGLADRLKQLARHLSGGERQLVAVLIAQLRPCSVMLLDEPLAALDPGKADMCMEIIRELHATGTTIIEVTHDERLAASAGDRTVALQDGVVVYDAVGADRSLDALRSVWASGKSDGSPA